MKVDTELYELANEETCPVKHRLLPLEDIDEENDMSSSSYSVQFAKLSVDNDNSIMNSNCKETILEL